MNKLKSLAIIPCRSGSESVKDKNIRNLARKPLMSYAIEAAKRAKLVERVIVDTDSQKYAEIARNFGADTPYLRPRKLAEDVPTELVIRNALKWLEENENYKPRLITVLQCTTPLVASSDIDECIKLSQNKIYDSAMTVCEITERPEWMFRIENHVLKPFLKVPLRGYWGVRQKLPLLYRPNGACYTCRRSLILNHNRLIGNRCASLIMPRLRSIDIDTDEDFILVETIIKNRLV